MIGDNYPTASYIRELLVYNMESGTLTWKTRPRHHFKSDKMFKQWNTQFAGKPAGHVSKSSGYVMIGIDNKDYVASRIIWILVMGRAPNDRVDHKDRDKTNNAWLNLREASPSENGTNAKVRKHNTTGYTGVTISRYKDLVRYSANMSVDKKRIYLGTFDTPEEARDEYIRASRAYRGEFAADKTTKVSGFEGLKRKSNKTGSTGVRTETLKDGTIRYLASAQIDNKKVHLGTFDTRVEAEAAYKKAKQKPAIIPPINP
jgi:hypothetical protein